MASEAQRSLTRIGSNYLRLLINIVLGLVLVRILLATIGTEAWGLIALLGSTIGLAAMLSEIVNASLVRELGEAYHTGDDRHFREVYNSALLLTTLVAVAVLIPMAAIWAIVPLLNIPDELVQAGRWMVVCKAAESCALIVGAAPVVLFKVSERMVGFNICLVVDRASSLAAALWLLLAYNEVEPAEGIRIFATGSALILLTGKALQIAASWWTDRRSIPAPRMVRRGALKRVLHMGGWNTATVTAMNLHLRLDNLLMNLFFGLFGNVIFTLASQLASYVRVLTVGVTDGVDAVSARISSKGSERKLAELVRHSTRLHAMVAIPAAIGMFVLAEPILVAWVGGRLENPHETVAPTVILIRLLMLGILCRSIGDGWIAVLYGAGHIRRYAPAVLKGGLANPVIAVVLITLLPSSIGFVGPALSYTAVFLVVHLLIVPLKAARVLDLRLRDFYLPLLRPALVTLLCSPVFVLVQALAPGNDLILVATSILAFGCAYSVLTYFITVDRTERKRLRRALTHRRSRQSV